MRRICPRPATAKDELPPHAAASEAFLLAAAIEEPAKCLHQVLGLPSEVFFDLRHRAIRDALQALSEAGLGVDSVAVAERLRDSGTFDQVGGVPFLSAVCNELTSAEQLPTHLAIVRKKWCERQAWQVVSELRESLQSQPDRLPAVLDAARSALHHVAETWPGKVAKAELAVLEDRRFRLEARPPEQAAVYSLAGVPICTTGNLATITASVKTGKSAAVGAMIASSFARDTESDLLGFESSNPAGGALLHFDSEQSPSDHWWLIERSIRRGGLTQAPPWLLSYCLTGIGSVEAWRLVNVALESAAANFGSVHSVLLDGVADFVGDVNDAEACNGWVAELHGLAIRYDCPIIGVIHFNPGTEKSRGHLGSQLERKAETNLRLDKEGECTVIWSEKNRRAAIPKDRGPRFRWCDRAGMHVTTESLREARQTHLRDEAIPKRDAAFGDRRAMRYSELAERIVEVTPKSSKNTGDRTIARWLELGVIRKAVCGLYEPVD